MRRPVVAGRPIALPVSPARRFGKGLVKDAGVVSVRAV